MPQWLVVIAVGAVIREGTRYLFKCDCKSYKKKKKKYKKLYNDS